MARLRIVSRLVRHPIRPKGWRTRRLYTCGTRRRSLALGARVRARIRPPSRLLDFPSSLRMVYPLDLKLDNEMTRTDSWAMMHDAMQYYFADLVAAPEGGRAPRLPDNSGFLEVADPGRNASWGLYRVTCADDGPVMAGFERAPIELCRMLRSAGGYPPALALARHAVERRFAGTTPSREEFAAAYAEDLKRRLRAQPQSRYRLAEVLAEEVGYLSPGDFVWVIQYRPEDRTVLWVSGDFHLYRNAASDFALTDGELSGLSASL